MPRSGDLNGVICKYNCFIYNFAYLFACSAALFASLHIYLQVQPLYLQIHSICKAVFHTKKRHIHGTFYNTPENSRAKDSFDLSANPRL